MDNIHIPDDIFHYLVTFLTPVDCMSFCLSGVSSGFTDFYSRRRNWKLSRCFCLEPNIFQQYFSKCVVSSNVRVLDMSHCFWLPETSLLNGCFSSKLNNLTELNVLDTELSLVSVMMHVMPKCQGLTKLSCNIVEPTWKAFHDKIQDLADTYTDNFKKITDLKLCASSRSPYIWILLFNVLGWCRDCVQLQIELFKPKTVRRGIQLAKENLYKGMEWMISLKGLCVLANQPDQCFDDFCRWLLHEINPPTLEKLWIPSVQLSSPPSTFVPEPPLRFLNLGRSVYQCNFASNVFTQVTHLAGIRVQSDLVLPQLRFFRGNFLSSSVLDQFCRNHPQLEHLHFNDNCIASRSQQTQIKFQCQWALAHLRTLIFANTPHSDILNKFMQSCSKLEELHIGQVTSNIFLEQEPAHDAYRSISKQTHLRKLTFSGLEFTSGSFLQQVLGSCQKLESLHVAGQFEESDGFFSDLLNYLPLTKNLRDLRIQKADISESLLMDMIHSIGCCSTLERLMIYQEEYGSVSSPFQLILPDCIKNLVANRLTRLVAFCFIYSVYSETEVDISLALKDFSSSRPSFWFYVDDNDLPRRARVPRVHLDEIVDPFHYIDSFPVFG
ncbi:uncharacterized protein LOC124315890 isoform X2 [Daphnia pulicaria]|uniref:uncharacterized protein LOC124315890 isoform X2 n=1 Tax=Daphnia pulicaria TaxID=35523 RepID=UPI001EEBB2D9|nr:uncharacterized protein LOC124315890 isoform X2 [Daphnia pulicaria]